jgi:hypothetical protein
MKHWLALLLALALTCNTSAAEETETAEAEVDAEEALREQVRTNSEQYLARLDAKDYPGAYEWMSLIAKQSMSTEAWMESKQAQVERGGKRKSLDIWRITVYEDPENAPMAGTYIAADYDSVFENLPVACGYIMWYRTTAGDLMIIRDELGYIDTATLAKIPAKDLPAVKNEIGCREES